MTHEEKLDLIDEAIYVVNDLQEEFKHENVLVTDAKRSRPPEYAITFKINDKTISVDVVEFRGLSLDQLRPALRELITRNIE